MRIGYFWRMAALLAALLISPAAWACLADAPAVTENDLLHPPPGMLVFRGEILKILKHGRMNDKPHMGFAVDYRVDKFYQGYLHHDKVSVEYGACQDLPGKVGDVIPVLAMHDRNVDWYAPQFWKNTD